MSLIEILENRMDPIKAGDGVRRLGEALGTYPETFIKISALEHCQVYPFPLWLSGSLVGHNGS